MFFDFSFNLFSLSKYKSFNYKKNASNYIFENGIDMQVMRMLIISVSIILEATYIPSMT